VNARGPQAAFGVVRAAGPGAFRSARWSMGGREPGSLTRTCAGAGAAGSVSVGAGREPGAVGLRGRLGVGGGPVGRGAAAVLGPTGFPGAPGVGVGLLGAVGPRCSGPPGFSGRLGGGGPVGRGGTAAFGPTRPAVRHRSAEWEVSDTWPLQLNVQVPFAGGDSRRMAGWGRVPTPIRHRSRAVRHSRPNDPDPSARGRHQAPALPFTHSSSPPDHAPHPDQRTNGAQQRRTTTPTPAPAENVRGGRGAGRVGLRRRRRAGRRRSSRGPGVGVGLLGAVGSRRSGPPGFMRRLGDGVGLFGAVGPRRSGPPALRADADDPARRRCPVRLVVIALLSRTRHADARAARQGRSRHLRSPYGTTTAAPFSAPDRRSSSASWARSSG